jgi:DNA-binding transcriptional LysR family regulator
VLDLHRLRLLRELKHRGTLAAVATALSYSPSAISQQLAQLETEAGVALLQPAGRRVRLTPQAEILVAHTELLLERLELAESELAASQSTITGMLRVAVFQTAALAAVPTALSRLAERHPALRVELTTMDPDDALPAVVARDVDLALGEDYPGHARRRPPELDHQDLTSDPMLVALPPGDDPSLGLADLAGRPWVMEPEGAIARTWASALCRDAGFEPDVRYRTGDMLLAQRLVETGHAVAILPALLWPDGRPPVLLRPLPGNPARRIFTAVRRGSGAHPAVSAFRDTLATAVAGLGPVVS